MNPPALIDTVLIGMKVNDVKELMFVGDVKSPDLALDLKLHMTCFCKLCIESEWRMKYSLYAHQASTQICVRIHTALTPDNTIVMWSRNLVLQILIRVLKDSVCSTASWKMWFIVAQSFSLNCLFTSIMIACIEYTLLISLYALPKISSLQCMKNHHP